MLRVENAYPLADVAFRAARLILNKAEGNLHVVVGRGKVGDAVESTGVQLILLAQRVSPVLTG